MDNSEIQAAQARTGSKFQRHDERLRWEIWQHFFRDAQPYTPFSRITTNTAEAYEAVTGRKWNRTAQDAR